MRVANCPVMLGILLLHAIVATTLQGQAVEHRRLTIDDLARLREVDDPQLSPGGLTQRPHATILRIHGGPAPQYEDELQLDWQIMAARGYAVVAANPRGSSGRGEKFATAIYADWGNRDVEDVVAAVDHVVVRGIADRIVTPTLFLCCEKDFNVPCLDSEQVYQALRSLGRKTGLVIYPGQLHGLTKPSYLIDRPGRHLQ